MNVLITGSLENLRSVEKLPAYAFVQADIYYSRTMDKLFRVHEPDAVRHLAAESHVERSIDGPGNFIQTNVLGKYTMLKAAKKYWASLSDGERKIKFRFQTISTDQYLKEIILQERIHS
jgi:dTDP-glucose 4,6-dehydratase